MKMSPKKLITIICLLIININVGRAADYSYDEYDEISQQKVSTTTTTTTTTEKITLKIDDDKEDEERKTMENEVIKSHLDLMSNIFRKIINKIKMKHKKIDMIFLVDASSSVGKENFGNEISFVKRLLSDFNVSFNYTRVALITFSSRSKILTHINQISKISEDNDKCMMLNYQIPSITYTGGGTNTYGALIRAKDIFEHSKRKHSKKILVLVTDGFSNGRSPKPIAEDIKSKNITIFTLGISSGNLDELRSISSKPIENYNYMLSSFSLFESLARKALHTDYKTGVILPVSNYTFCDHLCDKKDSNESCCDANSQCACNFHSGHYSCICNHGYYGTGLKNDCNLCPNGTYWNFWNSCFSCPDVNHETRKSPAMSINDCVCKSGFRDTHKHRCEVIKCPLLPVPDNGYFVSAPCLSTMNSACGARCKSGYHLVGSSIRLCQQDGLWSGHETGCVLKTCPALSIPFFGTSFCRNTDLNLTIDYSPRNVTFMANYSIDIQKFTEEFAIDTECVFSCALGYHLTGSKKRHCLPVAKWDGLQTSCKQILCPILPKIPFGSYNADECFEQKSPFGMNCTVTCDDGFELKGPASKSCGSGSSSSKNGVWTLKSKIPRCVDVTPPALICPKDYSIELSGNKSFVLLSSFEPLESITDNSGGNITFWVKPALKEDGTKMYLGNYTFTYVAIDEVKNKAKCNFTVSIVDVKPPVFENCIENQTFYIASGKNVSIEWEVPLAYDNVDDKNITIMKNLSHGILDLGEYFINYTAIDQSKNLNSCLIHVSVKERKCDEPEKPENGHRVCAKNDSMTWCDFQCSFGFGIMENLSVVDNLMMHCNNDERVWSREIIPECTAIEQPSSVEEVLTISFNSDALRCEDFTKKQENLTKELKEELCGDQDCELTTELPDCIDNEIPNESSYYIISKRDTQSKPLKKTIKTEKFELYVKISKNLGLWKSNSTRSENVKRIKDEIKKVNSSEKFKKRLRNMNLDLTALKLDENIQCNPGSVSRKLICVQCAKGTYHDLILNSCIQCALGTFNNRAGQTHCQSCPELHSTKKCGSRSQKECRPMCSPGTFARIKSPKKNSTTISNPKTLMPFCRSCGVGEYQSSYDQTTCEKCPDGLTSDRGSTGIENCYKKYEDSCDVSTCGEHGKCIQSHSFYSCECEADFYGQHCEIVENPCSSSPCFNDGICKAINMTDLICECKPSHHGVYCESLNDPCTQRNCLNGANCYEIADDAICECLPGFEGDSCERQIPLDFCASSPCINATCVNTEDDYECVCDEGVIGKRCHLKPCDYSPCPENSKCINLNIQNATKNSFKCECFKGLRGSECDEIYNPCKSNPCHNDAECTPKLLRDPNNVTTVDNDEIFNEFACSCPPYFYGDRCADFSTPDFTFTFEKSSVSNYVKFDGPQDNLTSLSFCSWIQTDDHFNYGSIISYANLFSDNAFTFTDYNGFVLYINGVNVFTDIKIIDNIWHFLCVSWSMQEGHYEIYLDGILNVEGYNLSRSTPLLGNGIFVIGQEQDSIGGDFSESESFIGKISYLDFWDRSLNAIEVNEYYRTCDPYRGSFVSWTDLKFKTVGNIKIDKSEFCKACSHNLTIENAQIIYGDQTAFVKCLEGFKIEGKPFLFCLRTSKWDLSRLPACKIVKCDALKTPSNGRLQLTKLSYKGTAKFNCEQGFHLVGNDSITCTDQGKWSAETPTCKSIFECPALKEPANGNLVYASDSGIIDENHSTYPLGAFVEIRCNDGYATEHENLITCSDNGEWDLEVENCLKINLEIPREFWQDFKEFLTRSCVEKKPKLCAKYDTKEFSTNLALFELPESVEYEGLDLKLFHLLKDMPQSNNLNAGNFMRTLLKEQINDEHMIHAFRFVIHLYLDLILMAEEMGMAIGNELDGNINNNIKILIRKHMQVIYANYLKN